MKRVLRFLLTIAVLISNNYLIDAQIYLAPNGSDNNNGSIERPLKTVNSAIKRAVGQRTESRSSDNVKIVLKGGTYVIDRPIEITQRDWNGKYTLTIEGDEVDVPVIKGSLSLGSFTINNNGIWTMDLSNVLKNKAIDFQQLYVNGKRAVRARTPNDGILYKTRSVKETPLKNSTRQVLQTVSLTNEQNNVLRRVAGNYKNIVISFNHKWDRTRGFVNNVSPRNNSLSFITEPMPTFIDLNSASQFYFENSLAFLDAPGEWFLDDKKILYYIPLNGENINTTIAEVPLLAELLNITGNAGNVVKNIEFKNISFQHTKYVMPPAGEMPNQAAYLTGAAININYAQNIRFENCEIANVSNSTMWIKTGCSYIVVTRCHIHDLGIGGMKIGNYIASSRLNDATQHIIVENNIIQSGGYEIPTGVGVIILHSGNNTISHNDIADFRYSGISVGWIWGYKPSQAVNNKIIYNHIHHLGYGELSDLGGVYTLGVSPGTTVSNNVIHDIFSYDFRGWGLYTDEGSSNILMENNLVYNCRNAGFHQHYGQNNIIRNNIFANQIYSQLEASRVENHNSFTFTNNIVYFNSGKLSDRTGWETVQFKSDNNLYWNTRTKNILFYNFTFNHWKNKTGKDKNSIIVDPLFIDPASGDFRFRSKVNINKINFKPFDYSQAGVYGDAKWKARAVLNPDIIKVYNTKVNKVIAEISQ